VPELLYAYFGP